MAIPVVKNVSPPSKIRSTILSRKKKRVMKFSKLQVALHKRRVKIRSVAVKFSFSSGPNRSRLELELKLVRKAGYARVVVR